MPITRRAQPAHVKWTRDGFTPAVAEAIEKNFRTLFVDMGTATDFIDADRGGTGVTSYTAGDMLYADADAELTTLAIGSAGNILRVSGGIPDWTTFTIPDTFAQGDILYAQTANILAGLTKDANATRYLSNTGSSNNPAWAQVALTTGVTGVLPVANGGTNASSWTAGSIIFAGASGTSLAQDNSNLFWDNSNDRLGIATASPGYRLDVRSASTASVAHFGDSSSDEGIYITGFSSTDAAVIGTAAFDSSNWIAKATTAGLISFDTSNTVFFNNSGLTGGNSFSPTEIARITTSGLTMASGKNITLTGKTQSHVLFVGASAVVSTDSNFVWDETNNYLGIGITPGGTLDVSGSFTADQAFATRFSGTHSTATAGTVYGGQFNAIDSHTSGTMNSVVGLTNAARFQGTANTSNLTGEQCFYCIQGSSPSGTITTAQALNISQISNFASGTPAVTFTQARGIIIQDLGNTHGVNGLTVTNSSAISIAGSQTAATNSVVINISNTTSVPFAPSGTWAIYNASTRNNHIAGPILLGGTTAAGSGTNYLQFSNGTEVGTTAADTSALYTADVVAGDSNLFATNEADVVNQLTGLHVRKTADEAIANNTYQDDNHLTINVKASSSYEFEFYGIYTNAATAGIKVQIDGTAGVSSLLGNTHIYDAAGALLAFQRFTAFNTSTGSDSANGYFTIKGVIEVSTAGTLRLEWAQNTTDAGNSTTLLENSFLVIRKLNA